MGYPSLTPAVQILSAIFEDVLIVKFDKAASVYLIAAVQEDRSVQYQVSDGLPDARSTSHDFRDPFEALKEYDRLVREGW